MRALDVVSRAAWLPALGVLTLCASASESRASTPASTASSWLVVLSGPPALASLPDEVGVSSPLGRELVARRLRELELDHSALRPVLEGEGATVTADLTRVLNAFQVLASAEQVERITRLPGVEHVEPAPRVTLGLASALPALGVPALWQLATPLTGSGLRVGIVDSGIDYLHADFGGAGDPATYASNDRTVVEAGSFPTARVAGGVDLAGDDYDAANPIKNTPKPDLDPLDCQGHGTHVAGIAAGSGVAINGKTFAGSYAQSFDPKAFEVAPGVAPEASLYAIKIFGCNKQGSTDLVVPALEWAVDPNGDLDLSDRLDVLNFSLGQAYTPPSTALRDAFANAVKAGSVVVAGAGNGGDSFFSVNNLGGTPTVISVAASTHPMTTKAVRILAPPTLAADHPALEAVFAPPVTATFEGPLVLAQPANACGGSLGNAGEASGKIVLVTRGACPTEDKIKAAQAAGAKAVLVADTLQADAPLLLTAATAFKAQIPVLSLRRPIGEALLAQTSGSVTVKLDPALSVTLPGDGITEFSARGPSFAAVLAKPDLAAPGLGISSAHFGTGHEAISLQGTSMATPFVSGAAALLRQARPTLAPATVAALLINGAAPVQSLEGQPYASSRVGAGRLDIAAALAGAITARLEGGQAAQVGVLFEPAVVAEPATRSAKIEVENHGTTAVTLAASAKLHHALPGLAVDVTPAQLTLAAAASQTVTLTLSIDPAKLGAPLPDPTTPAITKDGLLRQHLSEASGSVTFQEAGGSQRALVPFDGIVRAAGHRSAGEPSACAGGEGSLPLSGDSAHPSPVVGVFQSTPLAGGILGLATDIDSVDDPADATLFVLMVSGNMPISAFFLDVAGDPKLDFEVRVSRTKEVGQDRESDAYVARPRELATQIDAPDPRYVNEAEDGLHHEAFFNDAIVLPARLKDVGVKPDQEIRIVHGGKSWVGKPSDIAVRLPKDRHQALQVGTSAARFRLAPGVTDLDLAVFHSTNVAGEALQIVPLQDSHLESGSLSVTVDAPADVAAAKSTTVTVLVTNDSSQQRRGVEVAGTFGQGILTAVTSTLGTCMVSPFACKLGDLAPGAAVTLTLALDAPTSGAIDLEVTATSERGCESGAGGNSTALTIAVDPPSGSSDPGDDDGGCGCRGAGDGAAEPRLAWTALLLLGALARRARAPRRRARSRR